MFPTVKFLAMYERNNGPAKITCLSLPGTNTGLPSVWERSFLANLGHHLRKVISSEEIPVLPTCNWLQPLLIISDGPLNGVRYSVYVS